MIGIDWGTTSFRAFRLQHGEVVARYAGPHGILQVPPGGFAQTLRAAIQPWLDEGEHLVLLSGMVGSRQGWQEVPYLPCPAGAVDLARALVQVTFDGARVLLVPGLTVPGDPPEVMRGEEVQLVGALSSTAGSITACLPGSHSKWVQASNGRVRSFTTYLTGEAFAALRDHTILGRLMRPGAAPDPAAFARGVARSGDAGGLLHHLFGVRTLGLFNRLGESEAASYLSGLLIGHEIRGARADGALSGPVYLIGEPSLCAVYRQAVNQCGGASIIAGEDAAAHGLAMIGEYASWT